MAGTDLSRDDAVMGPRGVREARQLAEQRAAELGLAHLADDAALAVSELMTNAILHGSGCTGVSITPIGGGLRVAVSDRSRSLPLLGQPSEGAMTGRGMRIVERLASDWGVTPNDDGKTIWIDLTGVGNHEVLDPEDLLELWAEHDDEIGHEPRYRVELGEVPTDFLLAAKGHVDNLVREFDIIATGAVTGVPVVPGHLEQLLAIVTDRFAEARLSIKQQALRAAHRGEVRTRLELELPVSAADAGEEYLHALDAIDDYSRANRLFTLETEPEHRIFRRWYVEQIVGQLRAAAAGQPSGPAQTFDARVLEELREMSRMRWASERAARLYDLASALAVSATPEDVAEAVLQEGVAALEADAGGLLLATREQRLSLPGAIGYDDAALQRLRNESVDAELPAAYALRTGTTVWLETREERDRRFPEMAVLEPAMEALCAVPLVVGTRRLGALRFSFRRPRVFDDESRRFVMALADQSAQSLHRAQLQEERIDVSRRLQRSLLPPDLPELPGVELAAAYHPFGDGVDVGGDFYDAWELGDGTYAFAVGDASGTGPEAAALTALARHGLRALALSEQRPEEILRRLNSLLTSNVTTDERFCTVLFGIVHIGDEIVVDVASGGHPSPIVRRADASLERIVLTGNLLGAFDEPDLDSRRLVLAPGDSIVLFTDGVLEARAPGGAFIDESAIERVIIESAPQASALTDALERRVLAHCGGTPHDDMAIVVLHAVA